MEIGKKHMGKIKEMIKSLHSHYLTFGSLAQISNLLYLSESQFDFPISSIFYLLLV